MVLAAGSIGLGLDRPSSGKTNMKYEGQVRRGKHICRSISTDKDVVGG